MARAQSLLRISEATLKNCENIDERTTIDDNWASIGDESDAAKSTKAIPQKATARG